MTDGSFDLRNVFCSSGVTSLYEAYEVKLLRLSVSNSQRKVRNIARGTRFEETMSILRIRTWNVVHVLVQCPS